MKDRHQRRIVDLQKQLAIARKALLEIREYASYPHSIAGNALYDMEQIETASKPDHRAIHETRFG